MNNVTLTDIYEVVIAMQLDMRKMNVELNEKIDNVEKTLRAEIQEVRAELKAEIQEVDKNLRAEIQEVDKNLRAEIKSTEKRLIAYINKEIRETEDTIVTNIQDNFVRKQCV